MDKNERIDIRSTQNGYVVEYSYRLLKDNPTDGFDYRYMDEKFIFTAWDDVVKFVAEKKLDTPAVK